MSVKGKVETLSQRQKGRRWKKRSAVANGHAVRCGALRCDAVDAVRREVARQESLEDGRTWVVGIARLQDWTCEEDGGIGVSHLLGTADIRWSSSLDSGIRKEMVVAPSVMRPIWMSALYVCRRTDGRLDVFFSMRCSGGDVVDKVGRQERPGRRLEGRQWFVVGMVWCGEEVVEGRERRRQKSAAGKDGNGSGGTQVSDWVLAPVEDVPTPRRMWRSDGGGQSQSQRHRPQVSPGPQASSGQLQQQDGDAVSIYSMTMTTKDRAAKSQQTDGAQGDLDAESQNPPIPQSLPRVAMPSVGAP
ncbi:hypothetical protein CKAH01_03942 [Colletotrichum kahawae]|uniref:Uncharacterized protein n=1 Tax=Colletotrichum kahawae TaxID=34407 RepID=A0AAD9YP69_COLKA|nr:hypothetical protein CKAH01_03942 [Colletotrichum kahawae]